MFKPDILPNRVTLTSNHGKGPKLLDSLFGDSRQIRYLQTLSKIGVTQ